MGSLFVCMMLAIVTLAQGRTVLINDIVDGKLTMNNLRAAEGGKTTLDLGTGFMNPVSFEGAVAIGLDSLHRTGNCSMEFSDSSIKYSYQISQAIHAVYFRKLSSPYGEGSGYYRAFGNNITYSYTVDYARRCQVNVDSLEVKLDNVELCVQASCIRSNANQEFSKVVVQQINPGLNQVLSRNRQKVEDSLNRVYCMTNALFDSDDQIGKGLYALTESLFA